MSTTTVEREFTELPNGVTVEFMPNSHRYALHKGGKRVSATSPTGALAVLDKPALRRWYGKMDAEATLTLERAGQLHGIAVEDVIGVVRSLGVGAEAKRDRGADRGTAIHKVLQDYCESGAVPSLSDFEPEVRPFCQGLAKWLVEAAPEPLLTEQVVASWNLQLAGRFDLLATIGGKVTLIDLKTGAKGRVPEHHLQTAAYIQLLAESGLGYQGVGGLIVAVGENADVEAKPCVATWQQFLAVLNCSRVMREVKAAA